MSEATLRTLYLFIRDNDYPKFREDFQVNWQDFILLLILEATISGGGAGGGGGGGTTAATITMGTNAAGFNAVLANALTELEAVLEVLGDTAPGNTVVAPLTDAELTVTDLLRELTAQMLLLVAQTANPPSAIPDPSVSTGSLTAAGETVDIDVSVFPNGGSIAIDIDVIGQTAGDTVTLEVQGRTSPTVSFRTYDVNGPLAVGGTDTAFSLAMSYAVAEYRVLMTENSGTGSVNVSIRAVNGGAMV